MLEGKKVEITTNEGFAPIPMDKYTTMIVDVNLITQFGRRRSSQLSISDT